MARSRGKTSPAIKVPFLNLHSTLVELVTAGIAMAAAPRRLWLAIRRQPSHEGSTFKYDMLLWRNATEGMMADETVWLDGHHSHCRSTP